MKLLEGRVALVTGASRGIGRAIAQRLAAEGATLVLSARSVAEVAASTRSGEQRHVSGTIAETVELIEGRGGTAFAISADLDDDSQLQSLVDRAVEAAGRVDILINNAGFADYGRLETLPLDVIDKTISHYLRAPIILARAAIPHMQRQGGGWIVNISSITALPPARPYSPASSAGADVVYAAAKAGVQRFTQGLAAALMGDGIAVNSVGPSTAIRTPGASELIPETYPTEPIEYIVETVLAMCHRPARERSGLTAFSLHYPWHNRLPVRSLDGQEQLAEIEPPTWRHAGTPLNGDEILSLPIGRTE